MNNKRTSLVQEISLNSLSNVSIFEIGDSAYINGYSRAIAMQREQEIFYGNEGNFLNYDIFSRRFAFEPITEGITLDKTNLQPHIKAGKIKIMAASASSVVQIGNSRNIFLESRVKHLRQLRPRRKGENYVNKGWELNFAKQQ